VLDDISFEVHPGEVFGIIGPNGAGKTTLLNLISGITRPTGGVVSLDGQPLTGLSAHQVAARGISRTFQNIRLFPEMSVEENILVGHHRRLRQGLISTILGLPAWRKVESIAQDHVTEVLAFLGHHMSSKRHVPVTSLNYADRRRVELARAVIANPKILLLDEPAAGMTSEELPQLIAQIRELNRSGYTIIVIEHHMEIIREACHRVMVLHHGQRLTLGTFADVSQDPAVVNAYLGTHKAGHDSPRTLAAGQRPAVAGNQTILRLQSVKASYGPVDVLRGLDLSVGKGEITCLLGSNSAGKTTTLHAILGSLPITSGQIEFDGHRLDGRDTSEVIRRGIAVVPEGRRVFTRLTVRENLELGAYLNRKRLQENLARVHDFFPVLAERSTQKAGTLSGGEQQMLVIARALMSEPRLILLDEPSMGLAPVMVETVMQAIKEINAAGMSILLVEQNAAAALAIADHAYLLRLGQATLYEGDPADLDESLKEAYLA
jgi:ABC-type branched-subunit amino acid transport system ATPase component